MRYFHLCYVYSPLVLGIIVICLSIYYFIFKKNIAFETFITSVGLGVTLITWYANTNRLYKKTINELVYDLENKKHLNKQEMQTLVNIMKEPVIIDTSDIDNVPKIEGLKVLKEKGIIKKKLIKISASEKIFIFYYPIEKK